MDLRFADDVQIIVEEGSISDAAKRLNISQPALSARIRKLESIYGIQIFKRNRRPVALTDEGRMYLQYVLKARNLEKEFRKAVVQAGELITGDLVVGGTNLYTCQFLPPAICEFTNRWPGVNVRVVNEKAPVLAAMAAKGEIDLFITNAEKTISGITFEPLFDANMYFCVPRSYSINRVFQEEGFDISKLEDYPFILLNKNQYMGETLRTLFRRYGIDPARRIYTDQAITALALSKAGAGISLIYAGSDAKVPNTGRVIPGSRVTISNAEDAHTDNDGRETEPVEKDTSGLCLYITDDEEMHVQIVVAYAEHAPLSPAARAFVEILKMSSISIVE